MGEERDSALSFLGEEREGGKGEEREGAPLKTGGAACAKRLNTLHSP